MKRYVTVELELDSDHPAAHEEDDIEEALKVALLMCGPFWPKVEDGFITYVSYMITGVNYDLEANA